MPSIERPRIWPPRFRGCRMVPTSTKPDVLEQLIVARLDVDFDFGKAGDERERLAAARVAVARHAHQPLPGERGGRALREAVHVLGQFVAVERAAELDRLLRRLRERHAAPAAGHASARDLVRRGTAAERLRGDLLQLALRVHPRRVRRPASSRASSGCRLKYRSTAGCATVLPQVTSTCSHGTPRISADTRCTSITDSVPKFPMPDCT